MTAEINVTLERPIAFGDQMITRVTLRPPTLEELNDIGVVVERVSFCGGWWENIHWDRLGDLIQACVVAPANAPAWIGQAGAADTYKLAEAVGRVWDATQTAADAYKISEAIGRIWAAAKTADDAYELTQAIRRLWWATPTLRVSVPRRGTQNADANMRGVSISPEENGAN